RCATMSPATVMSSVSTSVCQVSTSGRPFTKRWSSSSQVPQRLPSEYVSSTGRVRYGTGFAGSETYASYAAASVGASKDSLPSARKYSFLLVTPSFGGHASQDFHVFDPVSKTVASCAGREPLSCSQ